MMTTDIDIFIKSLVKFHSINEQIKLKMAALGCAGVYEVVGAYSPKRPCRVLV